MKIGELLLEELFFFRGIGEGIVERSGERGGLGDAIRTVVAEMVAIGRGSGDCL